MSRPLSNLLTNYVEWGLAPSMVLFKMLRKFLFHALILALPDPDRHFSVVCDAFPFSIGRTLLQTDVEGRERIIAFKPRQLKAAEKSYAVHDEELLAIKWSLLIVK